MLIYIFYVYLSLTLWGAVGICTYIYHIFIMFVYDIAYNSLYVDQRLIYIFCFIFSLQTTFMYCCALLVGMINIVVVLSLYYLVII
jgi:hypothetical protein